MANERCRVFIDSFLKVSQVDDLQPEIAGFVDSDFMDLFHRFQLLFAEIAKIFPQP
jgi:hypothetical protein